MEASIVSIRERLREGRFPNEAAVSQGVVLRLLRDLSWNVDDWDVVWPEYAVEGLRVDYALCDPPRRPVVFVEVKQPGQELDAERQLFQYAFHEGVPLVVLTTGQEWQIFLPAERGSYVERRVYHLDLLEREPSESEARLRRYLQFDAVADGAAIEAAREDYRSLARDREIQRTFPDAWGRLLTDGNDVLLNLVADQVESQCGFRPDLLTVSTFLSQVPANNLTTASPRTSRTVSTESSRTSRPQSNVNPLVSLPIARPSAREALLSGENSDSSTRSRGSAWCRLLGAPFSGRNARDVYVHVFTVLAQRDQHFLESFKRLRAQQRGKRPYIARSPEGLFPGNSGLVSPQNMREFLPGWWIDLNLSHSTMRSSLELACMAAGLQYGSDLEVSFD